jgi:hydroxymethylpyrimidine/phosphomethylpyrimidine kinase
MHDKRVILTVGGLDPSAGAGVLADMATFRDFDLRAVCAISCIAPQNSKGVRSIVPVSDRVLRSQLESIFDDFDVRVIKIGMLKKSSHVDILCKYIRKLVDTIESSEPIVVYDPIIKCSDGTQVLDKETIKKIRVKLLYYTTIMTPNLYEAKIMLRMRKIDEERLKYSYRHNLGSYIADGYTICKPDEKIASSGSVCITSYKRNDNSITNLLHHGNKIYKFVVEKVGDRTIHGTGCRFASSVAAFMMRGCKVPDAVKNAGTYVVKLIRTRRIVSKNGMDYLY